MRFSTFTAEGVGSKFWGDKALGSGFQEPIKPYSSFHFVFHYPYKTRYYPISYIMPRIRVNSAFS